MAVNKPPSIHPQSTTLKKGIIISDSLETMRRKVFINIPSKNETFYQIIRTILIIITTTIPLNKYYVFQ